MRRSPRSSGCRRGPSRAASTTGCGHCGSCSRRWAMKTRNDCREWRELLGAYALGHLEGDERAGLEAHLECCGGCREELAALQPVARMLPHADPARFELAPEPPPELGRRIAATIEGEKQRTQRRRRRTLGGFAFGGA